MRVLSLFAAAGAVLCPLWTRCAAPRRCRSRPPACAAAGQIAPGIGCRRGIDRRASKGKAGSLIAGRRWTRCRSPAQPGGQTVRRCGPLLSLRGVPGCRSSRRGIDRGAAPLARLASNCAACARCPCLCRCAAPAAGAGLIGAGRCCCRGRSGRRCAAAGLFCA